MVASFAQNQVWPGVDDTRVSLNETLEYRKYFHIYILNIMQHPGLQTVKAKKTPLIQCIYYLVLIVQEDGYKNSDETSSKILTM